MKYYAIQKMSAEETALVSGYELIKLSIQDQLRTELVRKLQQDGAIKISEEMEIETGAMVFRAELNVDLDNDKGKVDTIKNLLYHLDRAEVDAFTTINQIRNVVYPGRINLYP